METKVMYGQDVVLPDGWKDMDFDALSQHVYDLNPEGLPLDMGAAILTSILIGPPDKVVGYDYPTAKMPPGLTAAAEGEGFPADVNHRDAEPCLTCSWFDPDWCAMFSMPTDAADTCDKWTQEPRTAS